MRIWKRTESLAGRIRNLLNREQAWITAVTGGTGKHVVRYELQ
ncbi:hypothetical protein [Paenibacillus sophorae]|nr:hypothetical protein [Paenibacillus sophorae]